MINKKANSIAAQALRKIASILEKKAGVADWGVHNLLPKSWDNNMVGRGVRNAAYAVSNPVGYAQRRVVEPAIPQISRGYNAAKREINKGLEQTGDVFRAADTYWSNPNAPTGQYPAHPHVKNLYRRYDSIKGR